MTDIARARAILTAVHEKATPGIWDAHYMLGEEHWAGIVSDGIGCVVNSRRDDDTMRAGDAAFITLMVDLYPAIDALLSKSDPGNPYSYDPWDDESVDPYTDEVVHAAVSAGWDAGAYAEAGRIAAAILAWAERTGYEV